MKAMEKDLNLRYQSATEMLKDLNMALKDPEGDFVKTSSNDMAYTQRIDTIPEEAINKNATADESKDGKKKKGNEALLKSMVTEGHLIGNHSYSHSGLFPLYGLSKMKKDLQTCQCELERVTSQPVTLFRPPFGVTNPTIAKAVRQLGYTSIGWSIRTLDTQQSAPDKILARIRKRLEPGAIILLHDRMPDSDQLVKQILDLLKEQGYTAVHPDKLLA